MLQTPPSVLAVDDVPANLLVIEAALRPLGFDVRSAASASDARAMALHHHPDLVLLDVMMPRESGIEACRRWRTDASWDGTPIVLLTALRADEHRVGGLAAGADDFLEKPIDVDALIRTTRRWSATGRHQGEVEASGDLRDAMHRAATQRPLPPTDPR